MPKFLEVSNKVAARDAIDAAGLQEAVRVITVGSGGEFSTLNAAISEATKWAQKYVFSANRLSQRFVEIRQLSGFVMAEQVFVVGQDLGYITITSEDAEVPIRTSAIVTSYGGSAQDWRSGVCPVFCADRMGQLPIIKTLYAFDNSVPVNPPVGPSGWAHAAVGIWVKSGSRSYIFDGCGVKNAPWRGLYVSGGLVNARGSIWDGAKFMGVRVASGDVSIREASVQNCYYGLYCNGGMVSFPYANFSGATLTGVTIGSAFATGAATIANNCGEYGLWIKDGTHYFDGESDNPSAGSATGYLEATGNAINAVRVENGARFIGRKSTLSATGGTGLVVDGTSYADVSGSTITGTRGITASNGSEVVAQSATITSTAADWGVRLYASRLDAYVAKIGGSSGGVQLNNGSVLMGLGATALDGSTPLSANVIAGEVDPDGIRYGEVATTFFRTTNATLAATSSTAETIIFTANLTTTRSVTLYDSTSNAHKRHTIIHAGTGSNINVWAQSAATTLLATLAPGESVRVVPNGSGSWVTAVDTLTNRNLTNPTVDGVPVATTTGTQAITNKNLTSPTNTFPALNPDRQAGLIQTLPRQGTLSTGVATGSGTVVLGYVTADSTFTAATMSCLTGAAAAGATPSLIRMGIYSVASNGDLTLIASTANDTALLASANGINDEPLSATIELTAGARYALGIIVVTSAAVPTLGGFAGAGTGRNALFSRHARISGTVTGQSDLPSTVSAASINNTNVIPYLSAWS